MAWTPLVSSYGTATVAAGVTTNAALGSGATTYTTTEADTKQTWRSAGTLAKLRVYVSANSLSGTCIVTVRKAGADTALTLTISAAATGVVADLVNTVSLSAGDELNLQIVAAAGTGTINIKVYSVAFEASTGVVVRYVASRVTGRGFLNTATHPIVLTDSLTSDQVAANTQTKFLVTGTARNLFARVITNTRDASTTVCLRINGSTSALTLSVGAGATGVFELTGTDAAIAVNDLVNLAVIIASGNGTLTLSIVACDVLAPASGAIHLVEAGSPGHAAGVTYYRVMDASNNESATAEVAIQIPMYGAWTLSNNAIFVSANTVVADSTFRDRKNGADGGVTGTVTGLTTGYFEGTGTTTLADGDLINSQVVVGAGGTSWQGPSRSILATPIVAGGSIPVLKNLRRQQRG